MNENKKDIQNNESDELKMEDLLEVHGGTADLRKTPREHVTPTSDRTKSKV